MTTSTTPEIRYSDALKIHLELTRSAPININPSFNVLKEAVKGYLGKEKQAETLIVEYHHNYKNWEIVIEEAKKYALSNLTLYTKHPKKGRIIFILSKIFIEAFLETSKIAIKSKAMDSFVSFWLRLLEVESLSKSLALRDSKLANLSLKDMNDKLEEIEEVNEHVLRVFIEQICRLDDENFFVFMNSYYSIKPLATKLLEIWKENESLKALRMLLERLLESTYKYWLSQEDPVQWLKTQTKEESLGQLDFGINHESLRNHLEKIEVYKTLSDPREAITSMLGLPDFKDIVSLYLKFPDQLEKMQLPKASRISMLARLKIVQTKGLENIHEEMLRTINHELTKWLKILPKESLIETMDTVMGVLKESFDTYPEAVLNCIRTFGLEIIESGSKELIDHFIDKVIDIGFSTAQVKGVNEFWQVQVNQAHVLNIRVWLDLIKKNPAKTKALLSALIVYLSLTGTCIKDTDLFQKDVSELLHAPIAPVYNLVKQLARLFPVYFNEIGAEGLLRSVSTEVDEIYGRSDPVVHFLRKQSHVESNNLTVPFIEGIFKFWYSLDIEHIKPFLPKEVYSRIDLSSPMVQGAHILIKTLFDEAIIHSVEDLLDVSEEVVEAVFKRVEKVSNAEKKRMTLMIKFYQLLYEKYSLNPREIEEHLLKGAQLGLPNPQALIEALRQEDRIVKLEAICDYLLKLKEIILEPSELKIQQNIYVKRHIAVDIPSMYGSYHEKKFDALGLTFRLENLANLLLEEIVHSFDLGFITRATFSQIARFFHLFLKALEVDGIRSTQLERYQELFKQALDVRRFTHSQYMDIFKGFSEAINQIINIYYHVVHENNINRIVQRLGDSELLPKYRSTKWQTTREKIQQISETFLRDLVARTFGLQHLDNFVTHVLSTLSNQKSSFSPQALDLLLSYDPEKTISCIYEPNERAFDMIHLGNKGYNLAVLHRIGIKVPPGFIITTEYFRCREVIENFEESKKDFRARVLKFLRMLEKKTGKRFGHPTNPLLLSVRSGATMSMPGMMTTFLNVGINETIVEGLIRQTGEAWFAWDNYRRFLQSWGMSFGIPRNVFDAIMKRYKDKYRRQVKREFLPDEIKTVARAYREAIESRGIYVSDDPTEQLFISIEKVVDSWNAPQARTYREIMGISDNWGTAVTVQEMIFGNLDTNSGAGVMFTHNTWTAEEDIDPNGDFTIGNQGEDVVGGLVKTLPISESQRLRESELRETSLERLFPEVYKRLVEIAEELCYKRHWGPQEIEFVFLGNRRDGVYVLQSRNMPPRGLKRYKIFVPGEELLKSYLASGIGVSGGALSGRVAFDMESIEQLRKEYPEDPIIFIRPDTVPDDIREISLADGILTGKGGATSHAAIVAHRLGKTCVVGCTKMVVWELERMCQISGRLIKTGDLLSIDGRTGSIYCGRHETMWIDSIIK